MAEKSHTNAATPQATAAVAQSRDLLRAEAATSVAPVPVATAGRDFEIDENVTRSFQSIPYERKDGDPVYRPLRIFSQDPSASRLEGAEAIVNVPYEPLQPGPVGKALEVDDFDTAQETHWGRVDLEDRTALLRSGRDPSTSDPLFHQQMVYAVCSNIHAAFRRALGRHVTWGSTARDADGSPADRLRIRPHAFEGENAYYDRSAGELCFGYFKASAKMLGHGLQDGVVFTCLSHDIVAHEVTHALLDGLRAHFSEPSGADVLGFHEGFADLVAVFQHFSYREVVQAAIRRSAGQIETDRLLTGIAHEFGATLGDSPRPLRTAFAGTGNTELRLYRSDLEVHDLGEMLLQAVFEAALTIFRRKTAQYLRLATGGTGRLPPGELPSDLKDILGEQASKLASQFLTVCIRAIDYCPPVDLELGEYLRAIITADYDLVPDDRWGYREALIDAFRRRGIFPPNVISLSEESLRWQRPQLSVTTIPKLNFGELQFENDPASPAGPKELERQARELGAVLAMPENLAQFGLTRNGDPALGADTVSLPRVQSIRSTRRIGPDGQIVFDLVAEVTQRRTVRHSKGTFSFFGGATVIIGPKGEIRYVVAKSILSAKRCARQQSFMLSEAGRRYWAMADGVILPVRNMFKQLHSTG